MLVTTHNSRRTAHPFGGEWTLWLCSLAWICIAALLPFRAHADMEVDMRIDPVHRTILPGQAATACVTLENVYDYQGIGWSPQDARVAPENDWVMYPDPPGKQVCRDRVFRYRFHLTPLARRSRITLEFMVQVRFCGAGGSGGWVTVHAQKDIYCPGVAFEPETVAVCKDGTTHV